MEDIQRDGFGQEGGLCGRGDFDGYGGLAWKFLARLDRAVIQADMTGFDQGLDSGARQGGEVGTQPDVETFSVALRLYDEGFFHGGEGGST